MKEISSPSARPRFRPNTRQNHSSTPESFARPPLGSNHDSPTGSNRRFPSNEDSRSGHNSDSPPVQSYETDQDEVEEDEEDKEDEDEDRDGDGDEEEEEEDEEEEEEEEEDTALQAPARPAPPPAPMLPAPQPARVPLRIVGESMNRVQIRWQPKPITGRPYDDQWSFKGSNEIASFYQQLLQTWRANGGRPAVNRCRH
ncbi:Hypothetical protein D9617_43g040460 [Elsinoe fawcettii]|nr:Hypothetical protein D9617_43g040460 [Elsinoe fawcettii]